jgi:hypothetical protein
MFFIGRRTLDPYLNGTKKIDHLKYPTLARAQRIHRYKNVKAREVEYQFKLTTFNTKLRAIEAETNKAIEDNRIESRVVHEAEMDEWDLHFKAITAAEDERKRKEEEARLATIRAEEAAKAEEERQKNLAIWEANEKARLARFMTEQKAMAQAEATRLAAETRKRDQDIQTLQQFRMRDSNNMSYGYRIVNVHGLYVRKLPTKASREEGNLMQGASVGVNGWIRGEELYGNPIWFKLANDVGWVWSGGVDNKSTSGLINYNYMNEPGDTFVSKSADGTVCQTYSTPSQMQSMIDAELSALQKEQDDARQAEQMRNPFSATMITADKIQAGSIEVSSFGMKVRPSRDDEYVTVEKKIKRGEHTKNFMSSPQKHVDFWSGTEFANPEYFDEYDNQ